jgi:hypothetical protein
MRQKATLFDRNRTRREREPHWRSLKNFVYLSLEYTKRHCPQDQLSFYTSLRLLPYNKCRRGADPFTGRLGYAVLNLRFVFPRFNAFPKAIDI